MDHLLVINMIGDTLIGKTTLLQQFKQIDIPEEHAPTIFDTFKFEIEVDGQLVNLLVYDTTAEDTYEWLRSICYSNGDCIILCYAVDSRESFNSIRNKWIQEIRLLTKKIPFILVGTKVDLRVRDSVEYVTYAEGCKLQKKLNAQAFVECSALKEINLWEVFEDAVRAIRDKPLARRNCCSIV